MSQRTSSHNSEGSFFSPVFRVDAVCLNTECVRMIYQTDCMPRLYALVVSGLRQMKRFSVTHNFRSLKNTTRSGQAKQSLWEHFLLPKQTKNAPVRRL